MNSLRKLRMVHVLGMLVILSMILSACAAPAPTGTAPAEEAAAPEASGLPAEAGRGTDGSVTLVYWQEISILNPYIANGTKDFHAASLIVESLLEFDQDANLIPTLAQEIPTLENGGISEDLTSITYKLVPDVLWSDGTPLTADDFVFTWQYCTDPLTGCTSNNFAGVTSVEAVDPQTVKITFDAPAPYPYVPFVGYLSPVLQKAQFEKCVGEAAQGCSEQNTNPVGTGPYIVKEFRANDTVVYQINEKYRKPDQPHFSEVVIKGAEDASGSARAVLETGEADYGWNLQVEPAVLLDMQSKGNGKTMSAFGGNVERILINFTNPDPNLGDRRSQWTPEDPNPHPFLTDIKVRQALSMAIDRNVIAEQLYGPAGKPTCNLLSGPPAVVSPNNDACLAQDIEGAKALLEEAGYVDSNGDGIREKDGVEMRILYQTSTNSVRQKTQALVQQWWKEIGVETELKNVEAAVFFGGDPASPDTLKKFYTDVQMFTNGPDNPDAQQYLSGWLCKKPDGSWNIDGEISSYGGSNTERWCNEAYDAKWVQIQAATGEDRIKLAIELNDMVVQDYVALPLVYRASVSAHVNSLVGPNIGGFESEEWNIEDWMRAR